MDDQRIYIGPNVRTLGLLRNQVFIEGLPGQVQDAAAKFPEVADLIVPVSEFDEAERKAHTAGEHLHRVYQEFVQALGKQGKD
ncbi:MAG: hypothetical protein IJR85_04720 [Synergistaceae bacterium]|nr:hypothetical protein [Synergistaceae bacterium]